jgi:hypothetical protein
MPRSLLDPSGRLEIRSFMEIYDFCRAPVIGVPVAEVINALVPWLC